MKPFPFPTCFLRTRLLGSAVACAVITFLASVSATAHSVWFEPNAEGILILRFAEPDGKLEKSPGHLDELTLPAAFQTVTNTPASSVEAVRKSDHFLLVGASAAHAAGAETSFIVMGDPGRPGRRPIFYARWHPAEASAPAPSLNLDLVPTGKPGEVRVYFRGKPLGNIKAILRGPDERERELTADAEGFLRFTSDLKGLHQLRIARHRETLPGFHLGREHDLTSHNACLSWLQP